MKDFADISNSVGIFPDVAAQDCSGPGETDGTAIIADTMSDYMGFIQAILDEVGDTPNDSADVHDASQILDDLKLLPAEYMIPTCDCIPICISNIVDWELFGQWKMRSMVNSGYLVIPLRLIPGVEIDLSLSVSIVPGAARSSTNRTGVQLSYHEHGSNTETIITSRVYDDGTVNLQNIVIGATSLTPLTNREYYATLKAGNDGATNQDYFRGAILTVSK